MRESHDWEHFRVELTGYCYRMLGSPFDAEDAVQDTMLRAWRSRDSYDPAQSSTRTWLYAIATHRCLDILKASKRRRETAMDFGPPFAAGPEIGTPLPDSSWVLPVPDAGALPEASDPAETLLLRESIRLAFVAALQALSPRQRAVLILRDVVGYSAKETAAILGASTGSVTSTLQRARATMARRPAALTPLDQDTSDLVDRYCEAYEADDIEALVTMLHEDATISMPPYPWWLRGRTDITTALRAAGSHCAGSRVVAVKANGSSAVAQWRPSAEGRLTPFALTAIDWVDGRVVAMTTFLTAPDRLFAVFGLTDEFVPGVS